MVLPLPEKVLSLGAIQVAIRSACITTSRRWEHKDRLTIRLIQPSDIPNLRALFSPNIVFDHQSPQDFQLCHGILSEDRDGNVRAAAIFYLAYSTWDSRCVYINQIHADEQSIETSIMYTLADIANNLDCHRLVWQHYENKALYYKSLEAEPLEGWITLRMDQKAMDSFLSTKDILAPPTCKVFTSDAVIDAIDDVLVLTNTNLEECGLRLHRAIEGELDDIESQVAKLAIYENEPESVHVNKEHYRVDGYRTEHPLFHCLLLQDSETNTFHGMGLFYFGYDFDRGPFLYLEDLFVDKSHRGRGGGSMVMYTLASVCKSLSCIEFVWQALDWNTPAITFYKRIGAVTVDGLRTSRFAGSNLKAFSENRANNH